MRFYETNWAYAFRGCGFGEAQAEVGARVVRKLRIEPSAIAAGDDLPTLAQLQSVFQRDR
jgi:hypothetical protein